MYKLITTNLHGLVPGKLYRLKNTNYFEYVCSEMLLHKRKKLIYFKNKPFLILSKCVKFIYCHKDWYWAKILIENQIGFVPFSENTQFYEIS